MAKKKKGLKQHKLLITILAIIIVIFLITSGAKIWLYINFILGNDIIVKLDVDKETIYIPHDQEQEITFTSSVTTNPFCKAMCSYKFKDISNNFVIEKDEFTVRPAVP
ncbi:hypothetical protein KY332_01090, partial [Candidatus Woesearchaeota archaeon]|nr:hypothetical protein [Candidatus Woesearchaeota archaeon]